MSQRPLIHLDTILLIDLATVGSPHLGPVREWLHTGEQLATSAIAWSEFCGGPHSREQKEAVGVVLGQRVVDFSGKMGEQASRLFHATGRKSGSHTECMIAAAAMVSGGCLATRHLARFQKFVPLGLLLMPVVTLGIEAGE